MLLVHLVPDLIGFGYQKQKDGINLVVLVAPVVPVQKAEVVGPGKFICFVNIKLNKRQVPFEMGICDNFLPARHLSLRAFYFS